MKNFLIVFVCLILFFGCAKKQSDIITREPFPVNAIIATNQEIQSSMASAVMLQGIKKVNIHSQTAGEIVSVNAQLGKNVKAGEVLLTIENSVQAANLKQSIGAVEEAKLNFDANDRLFVQNKISKAEFIRSQNNLLAAQTVLATAKKAFDDTKITAPFNGIITMQSDVIQKGNSISLGIPLFTIIDISKLKTKISLGEKEIGQIAIGSQAKVSIAAAGVDISGKITAVSSGSDAQTGTFSVEAEFENPDLSVKDGMSGIISLYSGKTQSGILTPSSSVINNRSVLLVKNGLVESVPVSVEPISAGRVMILSGVSENDTIIVSGITQLSSGDTVSVNIVEN